MQVHISNTNSLRTSITTPDGTSLAARSVEFRAGVDGIATAKVELVSASIDALADAKFMVMHPVTHKMMEVKAIMFADGSIWPPLHEVVAVTNMTDPITRYMVVPSQER